MGRFLVLNSMSFNQEVGLQNQQSGPSTQISSYS